MSTAYELAKLKAGDPMGDVGRETDIAGADVLSYQLAKDRIDEITHAERELEKELEKGSGWGSFLDSILSMGLEYGAKEGAQSLSQFQGMANPSLNLGFLSNPYVAGGIALLTALGGKKFSEKREKARLDSVPLRRFKALEEKFKNRKEGKYVEKVVDKVDEGLEKRVKDYGKSSLLSSLALPLSEELGFGDVDWMEKAGDMIVDPVVDASGNQIGSIPTGDYAPLSFIDPMNSLEVAMIDQLIPMANISVGNVLQDFQDKDIGQIASLLARLGLAPMQSQGLSEWEAGELDYPIFINPYKSIT